MPRKIDEKRLFETVLRLWVDRGHVGTTTKQIAKLAGVNEATLFRRYGNKGKLVLSAICESLRNVPLRTLIATDDVEADLRHTVETYWKTQQLVGPIFPLLLVEASQHSELRPALKIAWENNGFMIRMLEHHQDRGTLQKENPLTMLASLIGPLFTAGLFLRAQLPVLPTLDVEEHVRKFLHGRANTVADHPARNVPP